MQCVFLRRSGSSPVVVYCNLLFRGLMSRKKKVCFLFLLLVPFFCWAEQDSSYVKVYRDHLVVSTYSGIRMAQLQYKNKGMEDLQTYYPNTSPELGIGLAWNRLAIRTKIYGFRPSEKYGKTTSFDFQSHWYLPKIQLSLSIQNYTGFHTKNKLNGNAVVIRPDMKLKLYRVYGQYLLSRGDFSNRSAFVHDERQLQPAGCFKIGIGFYYSSVSSDSALIPDKNVKYDQTLEDYQITPNAGYAYNFVFGKRDNWFAHLSGNIGLGISVKNNDGKTMVFPTFYSSAAFGYTERNWTAGVSAHFLQSQVSKSGNIFTNLNSGIFSLTLSYRIPFDIKGWIKEKRRAF